MPPRRRRPHTVAAGTASMAPASVPRAALAPPPAPWGSGAPAAAKGAAHDAAHDAARDADTGDTIAWVADGEAA